MELLRPFGTRIQVIRGTSAHQLLDALKSLSRAHKGHHSNGQEEVSISKRSLLGTLEWIEIRFSEKNQQVQANKGFFTMNGHLGEFLASSIARRQRRLTISGLNAALDSAVGESWLTRGNRKLLRRFIVQVFHLKATYIAELGVGGTHRPLPQEEEGRRPLLERRLEKTAVRALYALQLEMGEVTIHAGEDGRFTVEQVTAMPDYRGEERAKRAAQVIWDTAEELWKHQGTAKEGRKALLGMDPEFLLFNRVTGKVIPASRYLGFAGEAGCDSLRYRGERRFPLVELRPKPAGEPREVLVHLLHAFQLAYRSIDDKELQWQAGGMPQRGFPLGGHIHFSGIPLTFELLQVLDNYLALPVAALEDRRSFGRRPRYGYLGDFRLQPHGGFEYRTLPSFLISPLVTKGVVAIAALIAGNAERLPRRPLDDEKIHAAFYQGDQGRLREELPQLHSDLKKLAAYSQYEGYIAPFMEAAGSGRTWDETADIRRFWKLENHS
ncbi:hypothetical protein YSY43_41460 [Paenibacillus sp. YSY-4.3]